MVSRRHVLRMLGMTTGAALAGSMPRDAGAAAIKETGLGHEGLLAGEPGFQRRTVMPLPHEALPDFLSAAQLASHYGEYTRAVERLNRVEQALARGDTERSRYADLRHEQVAAANGVLLHEFYFRNLAPAKVAPSRYIEGHVHEHMGSLAEWAADFTTCALAAKSWAALIYDPYDDRWHNTIIDGEQDGIWIGGNPLVVCDVAEHAYAHDFRGRDEYVRAFLDHLDWDEVAKRYRRVDRM